MELKLFQSQLHIFRLEGDIGTLFTLRRLEEGVWMGDDSKPKEPLLTGPNKDCFILKRRRGVSFPLEWRSVGLVGM